MVLHLHGVKTWGPSHHREVARLHDLNVPLLLLLGRSVKLREPVWLLQHGCHLLLLGKYRGCCALLHDHRFMQRRHDFYLLRQHRRNHFLWRLRFIFLRGGFFTLSLFKIGGGHCRDVINDHLSFYSLLKRIHILNLKEMLRNHGRVSRHSDSTSVYQLRVSFNELPPLVFIRNLKIIVVFLFLLHQRTISLHLLFNVHKAYVLKSSIVSKTITFVLSLIFEFP